MAKFFFILVELARIMVDPFFLMKITKKTSPVLNEQGNLLAEVLGILSSRYDFQEFNCDCYRWIVYS